MACAIRHPTPPAPRLPWTRPGGELLTDSDSDESVSSAHSSPDRRAAGSWRRNGDGRQMHNGKTGPTPHGATRKKLRDFLGDLLDSGEVHGLRWTDKKSKTFKMPWRHANKRDNGYVPERDTQLTKLWAINTQKYNPARNVQEPSRWKTNFRCALNSLRHSIVEVTHHEAQGYKVFRFDDTRRGRGRSRHSKTGGSDSPKSPSSPQSQGASPSTPNRPQKPLGARSHPTPASPCSTTSAGTSQPSRSTIKDFLPASRDARTVSSASAYSLHKDPIMQFSTPDSLPLTDIFDDDISGWSECVTAAGSSTQESQSDLTAEMFQDFNPSLKTRALVPHPAAAASGTPTEFVAPPSLSSPVMAPNMRTYQEFSEYSYPSPPESLQPAIPAKPTSVSTSGQTSSSSSSSSSTVPISREHDMFVSVSYRHTPVAGCKVTSPHGCRLFSGGLPPHEQVLSHDEYTRLYGNCKMQQLELPSATNTQVCLPSLDMLVGSATSPGYLVRGLCFEIEDDNIYATRLCRPQVFFGCTPQCNPEPLQRGVRTRIFSYEMFQQLLVSYRDNASSSEIISREPPPHAVQLSIAQPWGPERLAVNNLISVTLTHCKAERLIEQLRVDRWLAQQPMSSDQLIIDPSCDDDMLALSLCTPPVGAVMS